jgi:hypothetical protein
LVVQGGKDPGCDADYTMFQADSASRLYLRAGEARYQRLVNLFNPATADRSTLAPNENLTCDRS